MINAVIIDDELSCRKAIIQKLESFIGITIVGQASNVKEGISLVKKEQPDILFLDIEMPDGSGFDLISNFTNPQFQIIFTTGHNDYAIKAFKHSAIDYLLKPVTQEDLINAAEKALKQIKQSNNNLKIDLMLQSLENNNFSKLAIPVVEGIEFLSKKDILYCKADGSYSDIHLINGTKLTTTYNLKKIGEVLLEKDFFRVHKSYIISLQAIDKILHSDGGSVVLSNKKTIPIARRRKDEFLQLLGL